MSMAYEPNRLVRFDWAIKRLLRDKASFEVLEGFLTTLLNQKIKIDHIIESEANKELADDRINRVDILAVNDKDEHILIEVQNQSEDAYFHRMLFGTSKLVTDFLREGDPYHKIHKVYNINILYFPMDNGDEYVFHGEMSFLGIRSREELKIPGLWRRKFNIEKVGDIFPEYYILLANKFDQWSRTPLDQWLYFLANGIIRDDADAPGLQAANRRLQLSSLTREQRLDYDRHIDALRSAASQIETSFEEGEAKGRKEGRKEEKMEIARKMKAGGMADTIIAEMTGLSPDELSQL